MITAMALEVNRYRFQVNTRAPETILKMHSFLLSGKQLLRLLILLFARFPVVTASGGCQAFVSSPHFTVTLQMSSCAWHDLTFTSRSLLLQYSEPRTHAHHYLRHNLENCLCLPRKLPIAHRLA